MAMEAATATANSVPRNQSERKCATILTYLALRFNPGVCATQDLGPSGQRSQHAQS